MGIILTYEAFEEVKIVEITITLKLQLSPKSFNSLLSKLIICHEHAQNCCFE